MAETEEKKKTRQELAAEVVNANASAGMTGQIEKQAKEVANRKTPPPPDAMLSLIPKPAKVRNQKELDAEEQADLDAYLKAGGKAGVKAYKIGANTAALEEMLAAEKRVSTTIRDLAKIKADILFPEVTGEEEKQIREDIPQARSDALDYLLNNAPKQLDKPKISPKQEAIELIGVSLMNLAASIGSGLTNKTGLVSDPGARASAELFPAQYSRIQLTEEKIREIEQKQMAIDLKYQDDVVAAKNAYEADLDETDRMYINERNNLIARKTDAAIREYGMMQDNKTRIMALTGDIQRAETHAEQFNMESQQRADIANAQKMRDMARFVVDNHQNRQLQKELSRKQVITFMGGEDNIKRNLAGNMRGVNTGTTNAALRTIVMKADDTQYAQRVSTAFTVVAPQADAAAQSMYNYVGAFNVPEEEKTRIKNDAALLNGTYGFYPRTLVLETLKSHPITFGPDGTSIRMDNELRAAIMQENPEAVISEMRENPLSSGLSEVSRTNLSPLEYRDIAYYGVEFVNGELVKTPEQEASHAAYIISINNRAFDETNKINQVKTEAKK